MPARTSLLPAAAWGEKDGTVTNSERRISRQRAFLPLPGEAKPDWWIVDEVARRMGFADAFAYASAADIFREHAALSAFENDGTRDFDHRRRLREISDAAFDALDPVHWPVARGEQRRDALLRRWRLLHARPQGALHRAGSPGAARARHRTTIPFVLNTGRVRDQWHTMTRTRPEPAARPAHAGAVRRGPSGRCGGASA